MVFLIVGEDSLDVYIMMRKIVVLFEDGGWKIDWFLVLDMVIVVVFKI